MLTALAVLVLSAGPTRIQVCGPPIIGPKPQLRILPRAALTFSDFAAAPAAFDEPLARPRSFGAFACASPALCTEAPPDRVVSFRRYDRTPKLPKAPRLKRWPF